MTFFPEYPSDGIPRGSSTEMIYELLIWKRTKKSWSLVVNSSKTPLLYKSTSLSTKWSQKESLREWKSILIGVFMFLSSFAKLLDQFWKGPRSILAKNSFRCQGSLKLGFWQFCQEWPPVFCTKVYQGYNLK